MNRKYETQTTETPIDETALLSALFNEAQENTAPVADAPVETAAASRSISDEQLMELINAIQESTAITGQYHQEVRRLLSPQNTQEMMTEEQHLLQEAVNKELAPLMEENAFLKERLEDLSTKEEQRATEKMLAEIQAKYEDFVPEIIAEQMFAVADYLKDQLIAHGVDPEKAYHMAAFQTRLMWDNPQGIENLYLLHKARNAPVPAPSPEMRSPDLHISGSSQGTPPKSWKARRRSSNPAERDSVSNDLFREL